MSEHNCTAETCKSRIRDSDGKREVYCTVCGSVVAGELEL